MKENFVVTEVQTNRESTFCCIILKNCTGFHFSIVLQELFIAFFLFIDLFRIEIKTHKRNARTFLSADLEMSAIYSHLFFWSGYSIIVSLEVETPYFGPQKLIPTNVCLLRKSRK